MSHFGGHLLGPQWGGKGGRDIWKALAYRCSPPVDITNWSLPLWDWGRLAALRSVILQANTATYLESTCYTKPTCSASIRNGGRIRGLLWGIEWRATVSCGLLFGYGGKQGLGVTGTLPQQNASWPPCAHWPEERPQLQWAIVLRCHPLLLWPGLHPWRRTSYS